MEAYSVLAVTVLKEFPPTCDNGIVTGNCGDSDGSRSTWQFSMQNHAETEQNKETVVDLGPVGPSGLAPGAYKSLSFGMTLQTAKNAPCGKNNVMMMEV